MSTNEEMKLEILSPEKILYKGSATSVGLPGKLGYMTVLPGHALMIAELDPGILRFTRPQEADHVYFVAGGFVEVRDEGVRVLVDVIEKPEDIDVARAKKSLERAQARLSGVKIVNTPNGPVDNSIDFERATYSSRRAQARLNASTGMTSRI